MAALTDDRAQLLLAGAFVFAVALLGLTIVLSAGNYTASLAGDAGTVSQGSDAMTARVSVAAALRSHVRVVNARDGPSYSDRRNAVRAVNTSIGNRMSDIYARQGRVVTVESPSFERGTRIKQVSDENFREPDERGGGNPSKRWELTNGGRVRNLTFHFSRLPSLSEEPFALQFNQSSGPEWNVTVQRDVGTNWTVTVERVDGSFVDSCTRPRSATADQTLDISNARMDGTYCASLDAIEMGSTDYKIFVRTPDPDGSTSRTPARGKFWLIVTHGDAGAPTLAPGDAVKTDEDDLIYSTTVPFVYRSPAVEYEADLRVAPGEIP